MREFSFARVKRDLPGTGLSAGDTVCLLDRVRDGWWVESSEEEGVVEAVSASDLEALDPNQPVFVRWAQPAEGC